MRSISLLCVFALACHTDPDDTGVAPGGRPQTLEESLVALGVDLEVTAPIGPGGAELGADDAPLGAGAALAKVSEVALIGPAITGRATLLDIDADGVVSRPWEASPSWATASVRATTAADLDGDGREELVAVVREAEDLAAYTLDEDGFVESRRRIGSGAGVVDLAVTGGDADGDGVGDVLVAASLDGEVALTLLSGASLPVTVSLPITGVAVVDLELGQLDPDNALEVALVLAVPGSAARWAVLDDATTSFASLGGDVLTATNSATGVARTALAGGVALGDLDGDGLDEVALGGLADPDQNACTAHPIVLLALDDAVRGLAPLSEDTDDRVYPECFAGNPWRVSQAVVGALDVDGDGVDEVHVNDAVYSGIPSGWTESWTVGADALLRVGATSGSRWTRERGAMATGDFDHDGLEDIAVYSRDADADLVVWGLSGPNGIQGFAETHRVLAGSDLLVRPEVVAVNIDDDTAVVSYDQGSHELVFTEPIVLAVLSAPPCHAGLQEGCQTSFGTGTSTGTGDTAALVTEVSAHAGFQVGFEVFGIGIETEQTLAYLREQSSTYERGYTLERTVTYTAGPNEDAVVFTSIPYDRYTYTVLAHPDPAMVGVPVVVSLPREPITLIADLAFYDDHVVEDGPRVALSHVPGDVASYPTVQERGMYIDSESLESQVVTVGVGTGSTEVAMVVTNEEATTHGLSVGWEYDTRTTAGGLILGWSASQSTASSLTVRSGESTTYRAVVGSLDGADFDAGYSFGMFTYVDADAAGREYQVIDYWVE